MDASHGALGVAGLVVGLCFRAVVWALKTLWGKSGSATAIALPSPQRAPPSGAGFF